MSKLQPGPELDALVAEKVMGLGPRTHTSDWVFHDDPIGDRYGAIRGWWCKECHPSVNADKGEAPAGLWCRPKDQRPRPETHHNYYPSRYSTSIADAWEVVEKTSDTHTFNWMFHNQQVGEWFAQRYEGVVGLGGATAPTLPHAICLAALKAVGAM